MQSVRSTAWGRTITQGVLAGLVGGALLNAFLWVSVIEPAHGSMLAYWQWVASTVIGAGAFSVPAFTWLGLVIDFVVAMIWAGGYAYLASTRPYMNRQSVISGLVFGFVVYVFMQMVLLAGNNFAWPKSPLIFLDTILAHMVFYGVPVAFVVARLDRRA